jgi:serine/threonine protein kinase
VADAIGHLHLNVGLAHLDIKVENVLFDAEFSPKLCDFGFSYDAKTRVFER